MLDRRHRLTSSAGFTAATRRGRRAGTRTVVVHASVGASDADPQIGFVVGRAVGNAVTRNRVKRRLRHILRARLGRLPRSTVVAVRALPAAADASSAVLARDVDSALSRLGAVVTAATETHTSNGTSECSRTGTGSSRR